MQANKFKKYKGIQIYHTDNTSYRYEYIIQINDDYDDESNRQHI